MRRRTCDPSFQYTLYPLYSFGLWLAVRTIPVVAPSFLTANESSGVGRSALKTYVLIPFLRALSQLRARRCPSNSSNRTRSLLSARSRPKPSSRTSRALGRPLHYEGIHPVESAAYDSAESTGPELEISIKPVPKLCHVISDKSFATSSRNFDRVPDLYSFARSKSAYRPFITTSLIRIRSRM